MSAIEENNRERLLSLGSRPASEMTKRERIAMEAMSSLIANGWLSHQEESMELVAERALKMADAMIKKMHG
jgi:hypothetical protein